MNQCKWLATLRRYLRSTLQYRPRLPRVKQLRLTELTSLSTAFDGLLLLFIMQLDVTIWPISDRPEPICGPGHVHIYPKVSQQIVLRSASQCCSQGQNPKAKDEAKTRTLKAEAKTKAWNLQGQGRGRDWGLDPRDHGKTKARSLESKTNFKAKYDSRFNANIPHAFDMTIAPIS